MDEYIKDDVEFLNHFEETREVVPYKNRLVTVIYGTTLERLQLLALEGAQAKKSK